MGRPLRAIKRITKVIRLEPDQWAAIDKAAGESPRHDWIVKTLLDAAAGQPDPRPAPQPKATAPARLVAKPASPVKLAAVPFGPVPTGPGQRLKKNR